MGSDAPVSFVAGLRKFMLALGSKLVRSFYKAACLERELCRGKPEFLFFWALAGRRERRP